jgi:tripartite-type tricarboxylate transporter receptor subunit TctC
MRNLNILSALCAAAVAAFAAPALAADIVKLVVPFAAGGPADQVARVLAPALSVHLKKTVIVDNRGGVAGTLGTNLVAKAPADGLTVLLTTSSFVITSGTSASLPYDPKKDFEPIAYIGEVQTLLVARPALGVNTVGDLIAKAKGGTKLSYGSTGVGSTMHIGGELFNRAAGTEVLHVPYRGAAPAIADLLAGTIDMLNADVPVLQQYVKDGRVKALVIYDVKRSPKLPEVPTATEVGLPQLLMGNWYGAMVPANTPPAVRAQLEEAFMKTIATPEVATRLADAGFSGPMDAGGFRKKLTADFERWVPFVQKAGIRTE